MDGCELIDMKSVERVAGLLGTTAAKLVAGLTKKSLTAQGDTVTTILSKDQATETRDAFVKAIYGSMFVYIVQKINQVIKPQKAISDRYIGVLDIFGFENFENNSFEQLCINLANENLQQFFVHHIFKLEQEQYTNEGVDWKQIKFVDNQSILDVMAAKPMNILALIDEEAKFPKGTDDTMLAKVILKKLKTWLAITWDSTFFRYLKKANSESCFKPFLNQYCYLILNPPKNLRGTGERALQEGKDNIAN